MKVHVFVLLLLSTAVAAAQQPAARTDPLVPNRPQPFPAKEFETAAKPVLEQAAASGRATKNLLNVPTHRILFVAVSHSSKTTPPAEQHVGETDVWIIKSGPGWVLIGGEITDPKRSSSPSGGDQFLGTSIRGGQKYRANAGDIFNIPPNVAHQALLDPGESMSYFNIKVKERQDKLDGAAR